MVNFVIRDPSEVNKTKLKVYGVSLELTQTPTECFCNLVKRKSLTKVMS